MENYSIEDIRHLDTREAFRTRIQVYLGSDDTDGIYQSLKEIINNATDESLAGYGDAIEIFVDETKNYIKCQDYGRGVPFGIKDGRNILVSIYTESHTGGKFDKGAYKNSSGLNGLGGTAACMSSEFFAVTSVRDNKMAKAEFKEGILVNYEEVNKPKEITYETGTTIEFIPDDKVFINMTEFFSYDRICQEIKNISYLNKGIKFIVRNQDGKEEVFLSQNGIGDFIINSVSQPLMKAPIFCKASDETDEVEIAFMWSKNGAKEYVFVNGLYCPEGGSPVTGAKSTITTTFKKIGGKNLEPEIIRKGLVYVINCKVAYPSFANQTKTKVNNANLRTLTSKAFKEGLEDFLNTPDSSVIIELMKKMQKAEQAADRAREAALNHNKEMTAIKKSKLAFINKLSDAEVLGQDAMLCITEGDSAGGTVALGRNTKNTGILKIRGKMLNTLKSSDEDIYGNEEIKLLLYALGIDIEHYDSKKLRYGKVAICVDADDDGRHIALLIMANLHRLCPQFLRENRLFWLQSPLFIEYDKKENPVSWYYTDEDFNKVRATLKGTIKRVKGLGQLSEKDLKATMFSTTGGQRLDEILYSPEGIQQLCDLMGEEIAPRKEFIFTRIDFSKYGEV